MCKLHVLMSREMMPMKVAVSSQGPSPADPFDRRFGRAPYLLVYDTNADSWSTFDNTENREAQSGAGIGAATKLAASGAIVLVTGHVGPKAEQALQAAGISVFLTDAKTADAALKNYLDQQ